MTKLKKSNQGVYYIYDYIPEYKWNNYEFEELEISQRLVRYKKKDKEVAMKFFTDKLADAIVELSNEVIPHEVNQIALVAVPPSKVDKWSPLRDSIGRIVYTKKIDSELKNIKKVRNCGELLMRIKDVSTSHSERRALKYEHILSMDFTGEFEEAPNDVAFIILDDITTTGTVMEACRDVLMDYDIAEENIYMLAIGHTIDR